MSRLYACIVGSGGSGENKQELVSIAQRFAYGIEVLDDGIAFDISGTKNIFGSPARIAPAIYDELQAKKIPGNIAIAPNAAAAHLHARNQEGISIVAENAAADLPLSSLDIDPDAQEVFRALGLESPADIDRIGEHELVSRYGTEFQPAIDLAKNKGNYVLTPNLKENRITWKSELDFSVDDFEQLIFLVSNGLDKILAKAAYRGFSTEHIEITLGLRKKPAKSYRIKLSFPTLDRKFWLVIIHLR